MGRVVPVSHFAEPSSPGIEPESTAACWGNELYHHLRNLSKVAIVLILVLSTFYEGDDSGLDSCSLISTTAPGLPRCTSCSRDESLLGLDTAFRIHPNCLSVLPSISKLSSR